MHISLCPKNEVDKDAIMNAAQFGTGFDGIMCKRFEKIVSTAIGVSSTKVTSSYTNAFRNLLYAWSVGKNEAVFVSAFNSPLLINIIRESGATAVLVDCDDDTWNMSAEKLRKEVKKCIEKDTLYPRAVIVSDILGIPFDADAISEVCDEFGLLLAEDAFFSLGATYKGRMAGSLGDVAVTSFEPPFFPGAFGRSGAILTNETQLAKVVRLICNGGSKVFSTSTGVKETVRFGEYSFLDEFTASLLFEGFKGRIERLRKRQHNASKICKAVEGSSVRIQKSPENTFGSYPFMTLRAQNKDEMSRMVGELKKAGIESSGFYSKPLCRHSALKYLNYFENDLPVSSDLSVTLFAVPCHEKITEEELDYICSTLKIVCR